MTHWTQEECYLACPSASPCPTGSVKTRSFFRYLPPLTSWDPEAKSNVCLPNASAHARRSYQCWVLIIILEGCRHSKPCFTAEPTTTYTSSKTCWIPCYWQLVQGRAIGHPWEPGREAESQVSPTPTRSELAFLTKLPGHLYPWVNHVTV